jgi:histone acetyltransferase (RNA polymerase elongator complex component)
MRWEDDIPMTLMKAGYEDRKLMQLAQDRVKQRTEITLSTSRESVSTTANEESKM